MLALPLCLLSRTTELEVFRHVRSYCANRKPGPLGKRHIFAFETFFNQYESLTLGVYRREVPLIIVAGSGLTRVSSV